MRHRILRQLLVLTIPALAYAQVLPQSSSPAPAVQPGVASSPSPVVQPGVTPSPEPLQSPAALPAASFAAVALDVLPLKPIDFGSPYASPRDAARHRLRATLEKLRTDQKLAEGLRGIEQAAATAPDYPAALFDLGVICAIAEKWEDAIWAYEEALRLDPSVQSKVAPELERLRLAASMDATPVGPKKRRYDTALASALARITSQSPVQAIAALRLL